MSTARLLPVLALLWVAPLAAADQVELLGFDMRDATCAPLVALDGSPNPRVAGAAPRLWRDNSDWSQAAATVGVVTDADGQRLLRIDVTDAPGPLQLVSPPVEDLLPGDRVRLQLTGRNRTAGPLRLVLRRRGAPYTVHASAELPPQAGDAATTVEAELTVPGDLGPVGLYLIATAPGRIDVTAAGVARIAAAPAAGDGAASVVETAFATAATTIAGGAHAQGVLPTGWRDDSSWAQVAYTSSVHEEAGETFLRVHCTQRERGQVQLCTAPLAGLETAAGYRLQARLRSPDGVPVRFLLRQKGAPYRSLWDSGALAPGAWREATWDLDLPASDQAVALFVLVEGVGRVDLHSLALQRVDRAALVAQLRREHPDQGPANLLPTAHLPFGPGDGWMLDRDRSLGDEVVVRADPDRPGPSGAPALLLRSAEPYRLTTPPFRLVYPLVTHEYSLAARGSGEWELQLLRAGREIANWPLELDPERWQRSGGSIVPDADAARLHTLRLVGHGEIHVDDWRCGPRHKADRAAGRLELALAPGPGDAAAVGVHFPEDDPVVRWSLTGTPAPGDRIRGSIADVHGTLHPVDLAIGDAGALSYDRFPGRELGSFSVALWVERAGERISPVAECVVHRWQRPRYWGADAPASPFGVHMTSTTQACTMAKAAGANWTRLHDAGLEYIGWNYLEPEPGEWRFRDEAITRYRDHGVLIYAQLGTAPPWASHFATSGKKRFQYWDQFFQPRDHAQYATYVRTVVARYRDQIDAWFVWNEPWIAAWWGVAFDPDAPSIRAGYRTSEQPARDFAALTRVAWETAHAVDPQARVFGFNTTDKGHAGAHHWSGPAWTAGVLEAGGGASCDGADFHCYTTDLALIPDGAVERAVATAVGALRADATTADLPVWMSEGNPIYNRVGAGSYRYLVPGAAVENVRATAEQLARYLVAMLANDVEKVFLYSLHAYGEGFGAPGSHFGALVGRDGRLHPAAGAHSAVAWMLEDTRFVERVAVGEGIHAWLFAAADRAVAVVAADGRERSLRVVAGPDIVIHDIFGNPIADEVDLGSSMHVLTADAITDLHAWFPEAER